MKKTNKFISVFLVLAMFFSMTPLVNATSRDVACVKDKNGNKIGTYASLADAISVAETNKESVIILIDDVIIEKTQKIKSGKFTLDLNGQTIANESVGGNGFIVDSDAELTVVDSGVVGEISTDNFAFMNDGTLIIKGGKLSSSYGIYSYGKVIVDGGNIQGSISNNGSLIVNGGTLTQIKNPNTSHVATVEINGGTFTDSDTILNCDGEITVKGGTYPNGFSIINDGILEFTVKSVVADGYYIFDKNGIAVEIADSATSINGYVKITNGMDITLSQADFVYCGEEYRPETTVKFFGKILTEDKDYVLTYSNNINAGTATVIATAVEGGQIKGETSKNFEITPKPVTATAVVSDKVYDGTFNLDFSEVTITFDGIVDGDDVGYEILGGSYFDANVGKKRVALSYDVSGEDVDNYDFCGEGVCIPESNYAIMTTANISAKDIVDAEIILGDTLIYNGAEQTQTIVSVTADGLDITYDISGNKAKNVGVYEITITGNGNFIGTKTVLYEIAPDTAAIDKLTIDSVKSDDRKVIEAVKESVENAEIDLADDVKKAEYKAIVDKCDKLLERIAETSTTIEEIGSMLEMFDEEKVTIFDKKAITSVIAKINSLLADENINETEMKMLNEYKAQADKLIEIIQNPVEYFSVRFLYLVREAFNRLWRNLFGINFNV